MTITSRQIRQARRMLGWTGDDLCKRANIETAIFTRAESLDGAPGISLHHAGLIQQAFERAGVRFGKNGAVMMTARS